MEATKNTSGAEAKKKKTPQQQKNYFLGFDLHFCRIVSCFAFFCGDLRCNYQLLPINANLRALLNFIESLAARLDCLRRVCVGESACTAMTEPSRVELSRGPRFRCFGIAASVSLLRDQTTLHDLRLKIEL